jgi:transposase
VEAVSHSLTRNAPQARVIFDTFHIMRHLGDALDEVRRREYRRLAAKDRAFIKGQRYILLSHREHLSLDGRRSLAKLLKANKRLNTAYLLKESFGQLWNYQTEGGARAFFTRWKQSLKWQRLTPYEKFAAMIAQHWEGIASYCHPENKVSLGLVEGLSNKIRVLQRRAYGYRDEDYLRKRTHCDPRRLDYMKGVPSWPLGTSLASGGNSQWKGRMNYVAT